MRKILALCLSLTILVSLYIPARAVSTSASAAVLMDASSGRVLYDQDMHTPRPIASITKLMTALVAVEQTSDLSQVITVEQAWLEGVEGSALYLKAGDQLTLETLLYGLLLQSGNDAAQVIACWIGEDLEGFAQRMNEKAQELGMTNTHFTNPSGLTDEEHYSSAYDMALLAYGFDTYPATQLCAQGKAVGQVAVAGSVCPAIPVVAQGDAWYPLEQGEELEMQLDVFQPLTAPIPQGTQVGTARWVLQGEVVAEMSLLAGTGVTDDQWKPSALMRWWMGLWGKKWDQTVPGMGLI